MGAPKASFVKRARMSAGAGLCHAAFHPDGDYGAGCAGPSDAKAAGMAYPE